MDTILAGKKLLIMGGTRISCEIVKYAKQLGIITVVADYNAVEDSPGKQIADEHHLISVTDVDAVVSLVRQEKINGVITGFSDMLLPYYAEICKKSGLPSYGTKEQFEIFTSKDKYKALCHSYGIPTVKEYPLNMENFEEEIENVQYPVLVKPVDSSGSRGISVCYNSCELQAAYKKAESYSKIGKVLVEEYLTGKELTVFWVFQDGNYYMSLIGNRHVKNDQNGVIPLPVGYTFPASTTETYLREYVPWVKAMLRAVGIQNGMMFMQCKLEEDKPVVYDIGYRLTGSLEYKIFGWGGKTGINCFVLITGYFMCASKITALKYGKLVGERYFYALLFFLIFCLSRYSTFSVKAFLKMMFPFYIVRDNFTACFFLFYLFIPFLNKLIHALTEKEHLVLNALCLCIYTILPSFAYANVGYSYVTWFIVLYLIASYIRFYPKQVFEDARKWGLLTAGAAACSWMSVVALAWIGNKSGKTHIAYFFVSDSNKILAVVTALCAFLFFKNLRMRQSRLINTVAASTFGVLLIHANSDAMRHWLWRDMLKNAEWYHTPWIYIHAVGSVIGIYIVCTVIDMVRRRMIEIPLLEWLHRKQSAE